MNLSDLLSPHFRLSEFASKDGADFTPTAIENLKKQAALLEIIRSAAGDKPIRVTSGYRSPGHNHAVGGATHSQHPLGTATDFNIDGMTPGQTTDLVTGLIDSGKLPSGGLGEYGGWVHYDHRLGNARWAGGGAPVPSRAREVTSVDQILRSQNQPESRGAAPMSYIDAPQGNIPPEDPTAQVWDPKILQNGRETLTTLMDDLRTHASSFNAAERLKQRAAMSQAIMNGYQQQTEISPSDIPGEIIGAPVMALKHLLAPLRRALGNREQQTLDMWGGQGGIDALTAYSGDPDIASKYQETPGAGSWLMGLMTDAQERRANAARAAMIRLGLYDKSIAGDSEAMLNDARTASAKAEALSRLMGAYDTASRGESARLETNAKIRNETQDTQLKASQTYGSDLDNKYKPKVYGSEVYKNTAAGNASGALAREREAAIENAKKLTGARIEEYGARTSLLGAKQDKVYSETGLIDARRNTEILMQPLKADHIRQMVSNLAAKGQMTEAQIKVLEQTGELRSAQTAEAWASANREYENAKATAMKMGLTGQALEASIAAKRAALERTKQLIAAKAETLPLELAVLQATIDKTKAQARTNLQKATDGSAERERRLAATAETTAINQMQDDAHKNKLSEAELAARLMSGGYNDRYTTHDPNWNFGLFTLGSAPIQVVPKPTPSPAAPSATPVPSPTPDGTAIASILSGGVGGSENVAVPRGNVGGGEIQSSSTLTAEQAAYRNNGGFNPESYKTRDELVAAFQRGLIPRSVADAIALHRQWAESPK